MKILVVENSSIVADDIVTSLADLGYEVVKWVKTGEGAVEAARELKPDLVMMDINLDGEMDGIEAAERINQIAAAPIIYLTAYSDSKTFERARKTHPFAYVVKPFVEKDLGYAIDLAIDNYYNREQREEKSSFPAQHVLTDAVFLKTGKHYVKIPLGDILYVLADRSYCKVHTAEKEYLLTMNLHAFEEKLNHSEFVRVSRSCLVNIRHVDSFERHCLRIGNIEIKISKSFLEDFQSKVLAI